MRTIPHLLKSLAALLLACEYAHGASFEVPFNPPNRTGGEEPTLCVSGDGTHGYNSKVIDGTTDGAWRGSANCVDLHSADLRNKDFRGYRMKGVKLEGANLRGAQLQGAEMIFAELYLSDFSGADLSSTTPSGLGFGPDVDRHGYPIHRRTEFGGSDVTRAIFKGAILRGADLSLGNFSCSNFEKADLSEAVFINGIFKGAYFVSAKLHAAQIGNSTFDGANFSGADLSEIGPALSERGADISFHFKGAIFDGKTQLPWSRAKALEAGMVDAKSVIPQDGFPGLSAPTKDNCTIQERP